jgi:hypothetical protein
MADLARDRDVNILFIGDAYPVLLDDAMKAGGWQGGQGVMWAASPTNNFVVTYSTGLYGGFLIWGSNETSDQYTSMTGQQIEYGYGIIGAGGWLITTRTFEQFTYASRTGGGPLVPISYNPGERLLFSLRGRFTKEDEWTLSGDPRAPNGFFVATVVQAPVLTPRGVPFLTVETSI